MLMCRIWKLGPSTATSRALEGQQHPQLEPCSAWEQELPLEWREYHPVGLVPCREGERARGLLWQVDARGSSATEPEHPAPLGAAQ